MALGNDRKGVALQRFPTKAVMRDDRKLYFGDGEDASLKWDNTDSVLDIEGGDVRIDDDLSLYFGDGKDASIIFDNAGDGELEVTGTWNFSGATAVKNCFNVLDIGDKTISDFTDTVASGWLSCATQLPAGAVVLGYYASNLHGFYGDTSAVLQIGTSTDIDRFGPVTDLSVYATADKEVGAIEVQGAPYCAAATTVYLTVHTNSNFTTVVTSDAAILNNIKVFYM